MKVSFRNNVIIIEKQKESMELFEEYYSKSNHLTNLSVIQEVKERIKL